MLTRIHKTRKFGMIVHNTSCLLDSLCGPQLLATCP